MRRSAFAIVFGSALLMSAGAAQASVEISTAATKNMTCSGAVCSPTAKQAVLNVNDLTTMLAAGDVKVTTGNGAVTITIAAPFSWTSTHRLTLDAIYNVSFRAPVTVAGQGAVTITTNDGGSGGDLLFFPGAKLDFWDLKSNLVINHMSFALTNSLLGLKRKISRNPMGSYALSRSLDESNHGAYTRPPIGTLLAGQFNGLGHTIQNLTIQRGKGYIGLFAQIGDTAVVRNLTLTNVSIEADTENYGDPAVGALAGGSAGLIDDVHVAGSLVANRTNRASIGLLAGISSGTIQNSTAAGSIVVEDNSVDRIGGLLGSNEQRCGSDGCVSGAISQSHASVTIQDQSDRLTSVSGGLVGSVAPGDLRTSYATGDVFGGSAGGLVGTFEGTITECFAAGNVHGGLYGAGGLVGESSRADPDTKIIDSYSTGSADASGAVGGLIGDKVTYLQQVYSIGAASAGSYTGGLVGYESSYGPNADAYWDLDTSGVSNPSQGAGNVLNDPGVTGLTDAQLKSGLPAGFDPKIWGQKKSINNGYPYLLANLPPQ